LEISQVFHSTVFQAVWNKKVEINEIRINVSMAIVPNFFNLKQNYFFGTVKSKCP